MTRKLYLFFIFNVKNKYLIIKNIIPTIYFYFILFSHYSINKMRFSVGIYKHCKIF
jgi:hypothetical protein